MRETPGGAGVSRRGWGRCFGVGIGVRRGVSDPSKGGSSTRTFGLLAHRLEGVGEAEAVEAVRLRVALAGGGVRSEDARRDVVRDGGWVRARERGRCPLECLLDLVRLHVR